jgi:hypothetical protein
MKSWLLLFYQFYLTSVLSLCYLFFIFLLFSLFLFFLFLFKTSTSISTSFSNLIFVYLSTDKTKRHHKGTSRNEAIRKHVEEQEEHYFGIKTKSSLKKLNSFVLNLDSLRKKKLKKAKFLFFLFETYLF